MPITIQTVAKYISDDGPDVYVHAERDRCMTNVVAGGAIEIVVEEGGEYLRFMVRQFGTIKDSPHAAAVQERLLKLNYDLKLVKACVDNADGEVMFEIGIPIEDGELTPKQVLRGFRAMVMAMHRHGGKLRRLIYTGEWEADDRDDSLERLMAEMRERIESGAGFPIPTGSDDPTDDEDEDA